MAAVISKRSLIRALRALVSNIVAWNMMVETFVLPKAKAEIQQAYENDVPNRSIRGCRPDIVTHGGEKEYGNCVEAVLGKEIAEEFRSFKSRSVPCAFLDKVVNSVLGREQETTDEENTDFSKVNETPYLERVGHQSYHLTELCQKLMAEKGIRLLEGYMPSKAEDGAEAEAAHSSEIVPDEDTAADNGRDASDDIEVPSPATEAPETNRKRSLSQQSEGACSTQSAISTDEVTPGSMATGREGVERDSEAGPSLTNDEAAPAAKRMRAAFEDIKEETWVNSKLAVKLEVENDDTPLGVATTIGDCDASEVTGHPKQEAETLEMLGETRMEESDVLREPVFGGETVEVASLIRTYEDYMWYKRMRLETHTSLTCFTAEEREIVINATANFVLAGMKMAAH